LLNIFLMFLLLVPTGYLLAVETKFRQTNPLLHISTVNFKQRSKLHLLSLFSLFFGMITFVIPSFSLRPLLLIAKLTSIVMGLLSKCKTAVEC